MWLGIDIGTTAVKVAAIRASYRKVQLAGLASVEVAQAGGVAPAVAMAVRAAMGETRGVGDAIAVGIEGARATVKVVGLPASASKQVAEVLPFELEASLPFDLDEAVFDYRVMSTLRERKGEELGILVGIAKTADVMARIDVIKEALAAEPERVGLGAFPIADLVPYVPALGEGVVAVVDLGTVSSDIVVLSNGEPAFARTIGFGTKGLPGTASKLARELRTTIAAHRAQGGEPPARVLLCGGGAYVSGAEAFLSSALEIPVEVLPPPALEAPAVAAEHVATFARYAKALGLAMSLGARSSGLNLRQGPLAFERGMAWIRERVPLLAGLAAVILVSFLFSAWAQLHATAKDREVLEAALATVTREVLGEETSSAERARELLGKTSAADDDPLPHGDAFYVMVKLSERIPETITHDIEELDFQKNHVIVHGVVPTVADAETIRNNLKEERCFSEPKVTRTTQMVGGNRQKYVLEFGLRCPEDQKATGGKKSGAGAAGSASAAPQGGK